MEEARSSQAQVRAVPLSHLFLLKEPEPVGCLLHLHQQIKESALYFISIGHQASLVVQASLFHMQIYDSGNHGIR